MQTPSSPRSSYSSPPIRRLLKAYWRYWRGDWREARLLTEAMLANDPTDQVAQRLLAKILRAAAIPGKTPDREPVSIGELSSVGLMTLLALGATIHFWTQGMRAGFLFSVITQERGDRINTYPIWLLTLLSALWCVIGLVYFIRMLLKRR